MGDENEAMPCCRRYGRPHEQCDRYPACDACHYLIEDDGAPATETGQRAETDFGFSELAPEFEIGVRDSAIF